VLPCGSDNDDRVAPGDGEDGGAVCKDKDRAASNGGEFKPDADDASVSAGEDNATSAGARGVKRGSDGDNTLVSDEDDGDPTTSTDASDNDGISDGRHKPTANGSPDAGRPVSAADDGDTDSLVASASGEVSDKSDNWTSGAECEETSDDSISATAGVSVSERGN
jgi:hypothetical protein